MDGGGYSPIASSHDSSEGSGDDDDDDDDDDEDSGSVVAAAAAAAATTTTTTTTPPSSLPAKEPPAIKVHPRHLARCIADVSISFLVIQSVLTHHLYRLHLLLTLLSTFL